MSSFILQPGAQFPDIEFYDPTQQNNRTTTKNLFAGKSVIVLFIPGVAHPSSQTTLLPPFQENFNNLQTTYKVDLVAVISLNTYFELEFWKNAMGFTNLTMIPDTLKSITRACGVMRYVSGDERILYGESAPMPSAFVLKNNQIVGSFTESHVDNVAKTSFEKICRFFNGGRG